MIDEALLGKRFSSFLVLGYPDYPPHETLEDEIRMVTSTYVGILHDRDKLDNGDPAKPHWHYVVSLNGQKTPTAFSRATGIELRFLGVCSDKTKELRYLLHLDTPGKFQYDFDDAFGFLPMLEKAVDGKLSEAAEVLRILRLVDKQDGVIRYRKFVETICEHELYGAFRRMGHLASKVIEEHNLKYLDI